MVQLVASAAASAIVTNTVAAQTTDGRARQTGAAADAGGGWFSDLLTELLQDAQAPQGGTSIPTDPSQQTTADASVATGQSPDAWKAIWSASKDQQSSADGQTSQTGTQSATGDQNNWLASWLAAMAQTQQAGQTPPTGTSPQDALAALLQGKSGPGSTPADAQKTDSTQDSGTPAPDANLLAALQSLAAQFAQAQTGTATPSQTSQSTSDAVGATSGTTPSNAQLAALLQTLQSQAGAMTGATTQSDTTADPQTTVQTADTAANTAPTTGQANAASQTPAQRAPLGLTSQQALHSFSAPVTQAPAAHSGSGGPNSGSQGQSGQRGAATNTQTDAQSGTQTVSNGSPDAASGNANPQPTFLQVAHDQTIVQQNTGTAAAQNNAVNAVGSAAPAQAPAQPVAANLQVGPTTQAANPTPDIHSLAISIATQSQAGAKQFDIRIDPPELGRVDVRLTVDAAGKAQAHLAVDKPQTLELLQKDSGNLARALKDSGVQLNNNGLQFSLKGQGHNGGGSRGSQSRGRSLSVTAVASTAPAAAASSSNLSASASGVDIRV
jgi:flagellar hook-length control protein FliK